MNEHMTLKKWDVWSDDERRILDAIDRYKERSADVVQGYAEEWAHDYIDEAIDCRRAAAEDVLTALLPVVHENTWQYTPTKGVDTVEAPVIESTSAVRTTLIERLKAWIERQRRR